ncbi:MAG: hypothetical protein AAF787_03860, partial [Chloroflexota bacterium]
MVLAMGVLCGAAMTVGAVFDLWNMVMFTQQTNGQTDIYFADAAGRMVNMTNTPTQDENFPAWSPDGTQIVYTAITGGNQELFVMDVYGREREQITRTSADHTTPAWSPDGTAIAYGFLTNPVLSQFDVFTINLETGERRNFTEQSENQILFGLFPQWSPDGTHLMFVDTTRTNVFVTALPYGEIVAQSPPGTSFPAWAPDGEAFAYVGPRDCFNRFVVDTIFVQPLDEDEPIVPYVIDLTGIRQPLFSPDGEHIVFIGQPLNGSLRSRTAPGTNLYLLHRTTGDITLLATGGQNIFPDTLGWSPDGEFVAYRYNAQNNTPSLCFVNPDNRRTRCLPGVDARSVSWQPDNL